MRAQIAITRNSITQASSDKSPPEGGVLTREVVGLDPSKREAHGSHVSLAVLRQPPPTPMRSRPAYAPDYAGCGSPRAA